MNFQPLMNFLHEKRIPEKQEKMLKKKFSLLSKTAIGKLIEVNKKEKIEDLPLTSYPLYSAFFNNPIEEAFMYPLKYYAKASTTGSMGKPKEYLNPIPLDIDMVAAILASMIALSCDGEKYCIREGYTIYANIAPPPHYAGVGWNRMVKARPNILKFLAMFNFYPPPRVLEFYRMFKFFKTLDFMPLDQATPYQEKVDTFIRNLKSIDMALMPIGTFLNSVYPKINEPIPLKAFVTLDTSASFYQDKIKEITGVHPSTIYGSTETGICGIPSNEHSMGFFFDWRTVYCEFLPEGNFCSSDIDKQFEPRVIPLDDVKKGKKYQLVVTPFHSDLTRYVMPDILECISKGDNVLGIDFPIFKYYMRAFKQIALHNFTRIDEPTILSAFKEAGVEINDFTARREMINGMDYLAIYLEPKKKYEKTELATKIHKAFCNVDKTYSDLSEYMNYIPLKITLLPEDTFSEFLRRKPGMPRLIRIEMKQEELDVILSIARELEK